MKKYLVVGNPIEHSLSPEIHNFWLRENKIDGVYEKKKLSKDGIKELILKIKNKEIDGANVTVPFKKAVISFIEHLTPEAVATQSVNTIYLNKDKVIGHNTDIEGFELSVKKEFDYDFKKKKILILGAGGVVPSIIFALNKMKVSEINVSNRTISKAENLKILFNNINIIEWGDIPNFDVIINATSIGLNQSDQINLDFTKIGKDKFFYDVIYNPSETNFLKNGKKLGNKIKNGKMMFVYQAAAAFELWNGVKPNINSDLIKLLDK